MIGVPPSLPLGLDPRLVRLIKGQGRLTGLEGLTRANALPPTPPSPQPKKWIRGPVQQFNQQRFNQDILNKLLAGKPATFDFIRMMFGRQK